jgi:hypothetical protein
MLSSAHAHTSLARGGLLCACVFFHA